MLWPVFYLCMQADCFHLFAGGDDYVARSITATLTNSTREACLIVPTIADGVAEPDETFTVFLNSPDSFVVIGRSNSTGTILDAASKSDCLVRINTTRFLDATYNSHK